jgi:hypothetical protein
MSSTDSETQSPSPSGGASTHEVISLTPADFARFGDRMEALIWGLKLLRLRNVVLGLLLVGLLGAIGGVAIDRAYRDPRIRQIEAHGADLHVEELDDTIIVYFDGRRQPAVHYFRDGSPLFVFPK